MLTLIIGGAASGKSAYAEEHSRKLSGPRLYIATMRPYDDECRARIARHRAMRQSKGFATLECYQELSSADVPQGANALLECMSNLLANEMYRPNGGGAEEVLQGVQALLSRCGNLTIVTNEVFSGGSDYQGDTLSYLRELARVNCVLAGWADIVVEVVCGLPNILKGEDCL